MTDRYEYQERQDALVDGVLAEDGLRFAAAARRRVVKPVQERIGWQQATTKDEEFFAWNGWVWCGVEAELMECLVAWLGKKGFRTVREVRLRGGVGRLDAVSWRDDLVLFVEAKMPFEHRRDTPFYRELASGIGQLLLYREVVESRQDWHVNVHQDVRTYGPPFWRGEKITRSRWACLIAAPEVPAVAPHLRSIAARNEFDFWCWLPPGELVDLEGQAVDL